MSDIMASAATPIQFKPVEPYGVTEMPEWRYYYSSLETARVIREDGFNIVFHNHMYRTNTKEIITYLDKQINNHALPGFSFATPEQIANYRMKLEPGTVVMETAAVAIAEEVAGRIGAQLLARLPEDQREAMALLLATIDQEGIVNETVEAMKPVGADIDTAALTQQVGTTKLGGIANTKTLAPVLRKV